MSDSTKVRPACTMLASDDSWSAAYAVAYPGEGDAGDTVLKGDYTTICHAGYHPMGVLGYNCPCEHVRYRYGTIFAA